MMRWKVNDRHLGILLFVFVFLYFYILTLFFTRPLITNITTHKVGQSGDSYYFMWIIGWFKQALFDLRQLPFQSHLLNHPYGYQLAQTDISPLQVMIALPFAVYGNNPVLGYNVSILSTFILSGITMFYWVKDMTGSIHASIVASTAYAFLPYHIAHMMSGHLNLVAIQWFPLYFWGFLDIMQKKEFSWKNVVVLAVGLSGIALSSQYYLFMAIFICVILITVNLFIAHFKIEWNCWKQWIVAGLISLPSLILGVVPYYIVLKGGGTSRPFEDVMHYSASLTDFLIPFSKSILFGDWVNTRFQRNLWTESTLYLGLPILALAIFALITNKQKQKNKVIQHMAIIGLIAFILSSGTNLTWMEQPVIITTPQWLRVLIPQESFLVLLPGYLLFRYLPFVNLMRVWMRYGIIIMVMLCALAGIGVHLLLQKIKSSLHTLATFCLIIIVVMDFSTTPLSLEEVQPRSVDIWLSLQEPGGQVQLPLVQSFDQRTIFYTLANQKPLIGQMKTYPSNRYFLLEPVLKHFPDAASISQLKAEGVKYVLLDIDSINFDIINESDVDDLGIEFAGVFDQVAVFIIPDY